MTLFLIVAAACSFATLLLCTGVAFAIDESLAPLGFIVGIVISAVAVAGFHHLSFGTEETIRLQLVEKERIADGDSDRWMLHTPDESFENTDAWFHGKTRSTDLQRALVVGRTYTCKVNGVRLGLLSSYRNVLECEGVEY